MMTATDFENHGKNHFGADFPNPKPGFVAIHGNAMEQLADVLIDWQHAQPLPPLAADVVLVQSNGAAEWFKMRAATRHGVCAATVVQLAARFAWRSWRQILGPHAVPAMSPLDEQPMTWRLVRLIPTLLAAPATAATFAPLAHFLIPQSRPISAKNTTTDKQHGKTSRQTRTKPLKTAQTPSAKKAVFGRGCDAQTDAGAAAAVAPDAIDTQRLFELAARIADVFDQYQVYRADWLDAWAAGCDELPAFAAQPRAPLPVDLAWQPALWRALLADLTEAEHAATRAAVHARVIARLNAAEPGTLAELPARVCVLGLSHMPQSMLEFLAALSRHTQLLLAVPNPCRYHWADAIDGRELLRQHRRRQPLRAGRNLAAVDLADMHAHAHPLLMAWARQSRDFVRLLDDWDADSATTARAWALPRIDVFDDAPTWQGTLLQQVQRSIRDLVPLAEHPRAVGSATISRNDQSIVFHRAHSLVRELEVLHDALLTALATSGDNPTQPPLKPQDIVVMLPNVQEAAPYIRAVFGQYPAHDRRHIPFDIADLSVGATSPMLSALQLLLHMGGQRWTLPTLSDWLEIPAVATRLGLDNADTQQLQSWMQGAGLRWGLNAEHRATLGLEAAGAQNTAAFALERMLRGWVLGEPLDESLDELENIQSLENIKNIKNINNIEPSPYTAISGLAAYTVGALWALVRALNDWAATSATAATPEQWAERLRALAQALFAPSDPSEQAAWLVWHEAIDGWLRQCEAARFDAPVALTAVAQALGSALDAPSAQQRFHAGGVTFCTPMPMRAIAFEMVCLLGLNEGEWPRRARPNGLDLMQRPGHYRPGDRQRRDHDRQLMLEAVLSARRTLYLSYSAHSVRDHTSAPPSVLVAQLRDYLAAGWAAENQYSSDNPDNPQNPLNTRIATHSDASPLLIERTFDHPMQPFSRRYFEENSPNHTWAREWWSVHQKQPSEDASKSPKKPQTPSAKKTVLSRGLQPTPITLDNLIEFFKNPAQHYLKNRLDFNLGRGDDNPPPEDEPFSLEGLENYKIQADIQEKICQIIEKHSTNGHGAPVNIAAEIARATAAHQAAGALPIGAAGRAIMQTLQTTLAAGLQHWAELRRDYGVVQPAQPLTLPHAEWPLHDWVQNLRVQNAPNFTKSKNTQNSQNCAIALEIHARKILEPNQKNPIARANAVLFSAFLRQMAAQSCGIHVKTWLIGTDGWIILGENLENAQNHLDFEPIDYLKTLQSIFAAGQIQPLPLPQKTAMAYLKYSAKSQTYHKTIAQYEGDYQYSGEAPENPYWQRLYPDFESLITPSATPHEENADAVQNSLFSQYAHIVYGPFLDYLQQHSHAQSWTPSA